MAPVVRGEENVPDGAVTEQGCLFVGNHTRFGLYDLPFLMYELYLRGHKVPCFLSHTFFFALQMTSILSCQAYQQLAKLFAILGCRALSLSYLQLLRYILSHCYATQALRF